MTQLPPADPAKDYYKGIANNVESLRKALKHLNEVVTECRENGLDVNVVPSSTDNKDKRPYKAIIKKDIYDMEVGG